MKPNPIKPNQLIVIKPKLIQTYTIICNDMTTQSTTKAC